MNGLRIFGRLRHLRALTRRILPLTLLAGAISSSLVLGLGISQTPAEASNCHIGSSSACPATSPQEIANLYGTSTNGTYWLRVNGTAREVHLVMNTGSSWGGGHWILMMKGTRGSSQFGYSSSSFTSNTTVFGTTSTTNDFSTDAKFHAYNETPLQEMLAVLASPERGTIAAQGDIANNSFNGHVWRENAGGQTAYARLSNFRDLNLTTGDVSFNSVPISKYRQSNSGSSTQVFSLQKGAGRYGHSVECSSTGYKLRWGIVWNNESNQITSCDAAVGIGMQYQSTDQSPRDIVTYNDSLTVPAPSANNNAGMGALAFQIWGKMAAPSLSSPGAPSVTNTGLNAVSLSWSPSSGATEYVVQYKRSVDNWGTNPSQSILVSGTTATVTGLQTDVAYDFRITARASTNSSQPGSSTAHTIVSRTISFSGNGQTSGSMLDQTVASGVSTALTQNAFQRTGYTFLGWNQNSGASVASYTDGQAVSLNSNLSLFAIWQANTNAVTFDPNGGSGTMNAQSIVTDVPTNLSPNNFQREGFVFSGWNTSANGSGTAFSDQQTVNLSAPLNLFAQWKSKNDLAYVAGAKGDLYTNTTPIPTESNAAFTAEAWTYGTQTTGTWRVIFGGGTSLTSEVQRFFVGVHDSGQIYIDVAGAVNTSFDAGIQLNRWTHIAVSVTGSSNPIVKLFVDGVEVKSWSASGRNTLGSTFTIGSGTNPNYLWTGQIDQVKIWGSVLDGDDIAESMHSYQKSTRTADDPLLAHYDFNDFTQGLVPDRTGNGRHLTLESSITSTRFTSSQIVETGPAHIEQTYVKFNRSYLTATGGWTPPAGVSRYKALVVAGGGGGGAWVGGGGGAGGLTQSPYVEVTQSIPVNVGQGGLGAKKDTSAGSAFLWLGANGQGSSLGTLISVSGGGRGSSYNGSNTGNVAGTGGSGGGGNARGSSAVNGGQGTAGQGFDGGNGDGNTYYPTGGGGGAGGPGQNGVASPKKSGNGGIGVTTYLTGTSGLQLAGGGGGGGHDVTDVAGQGSYGGGSGAVATSTQAGSGTPNSGGGGGGSGGSGTSIASHGGNGGSGVVILSWGPYLEVTQSPTVARAGEEFRNAIKLQVMDESTGQPFSTSYPVTVTASANVLTLNGVLLTQSYTVQSSAVDGTVDFSGLGFASNVSGPVTLTFTSDQFVGTSLVVSPNFFPENVEIVASGTTGGTFLEGEFFANSGTGTTTINKDDLVAHLASYSTVVSASGFISVQTIFDSQTSSDIVLRAAGYVEATAGSFIRTHGGDIVLWADSDDANGGFIRLLGSTTLCTTAGDCATTVTGGGDIVLGGGLPSANNPLRPSGPAKGSGNDGAGTDATSTGVQLGTLESGNTGTKLYSAGGDIQILGRKALSTSVWSVGIAFVGGTDIRSGNGTIYIFGESTQDGSSTDGTMEFNAWGGASGGSVYIESRNSSSEAIVIEGKETGTATSNGIWGSNDNTTIASSGSLTIRADHVNTSLDLNLDIAGELVIEPYLTGLREAQSGTVFNFQIGTGDDFNLLRGPGGVRIGSSSNSNRVNLASSFTSNGPIEVLANQIQVASNVDLTTTAVGARVLLKSRDWIDYFAGSNTTTFGEVTTNYGDIIFWSDSDGNGTGSIMFGSNNQMNSANGAKSKTGSGGGRITFGGGADGVDAQGHPLGFAGDTGLFNGGTNYWSILIQPTQIYSGGGDVTFRARSDYGSLDAMRIDPGSLVWSGTGAIRADVRKVGAGNTFYMYQNSWVSAAKISPAIEINAQSTGTGGVFDALSNGSSLAAIGSGGISITTTTSNTTVNAITMVGMDLLSKEGDIEIATNGRFSWATNAARAIGSKASGDVTTSSADVRIIAQGFIDSTGNTQSKISTSGNVEILPAAGSFAVDSHLNFDVEAASFEFGGVADVNNATKDIRLDRDVTTSGAITVSAATITILNGVDLVTTVESSRITLKSKDWIDIRAGSSATSHSRLQTNNGDIILWADANGDSNGGIYLGTYNELNSANGVKTKTQSGGGRITIAGSNGNPGVDADGHPLGSLADMLNVDGTYTNYALFLNTEAEIFSGGGDITIRSLSDNNNDPAAYFNGTAKLWSGTGKISARFQHSASHYGVRLQNGSWVSAATASPAIEIETSTARLATDAFGIYSGASQLFTLASIADSGGGISISATTANATYEAFSWWTWDILSKVGEISITTNARADWRTDQARNLGAKADSDVPTSSADIRIVSQGISDTSGNSLSRISTSGAVSYMPFGSNFNLDHTIQFQIDAGSFEFGKIDNVNSATQNVTFVRDVISQRAVTISAQTIILTPGADIETLEEGHSIFLKAKTDVYSGAGSSTADAGHSRFQTNKGDLVVWADSDGNNSGGIFLDNYFQINTANGARDSGAVSGGGDVILAGGTVTDSRGYPTGYAAAVATGNLLDRAVHIRELTGIYTGGGDLYVRGRTASTFGVALYRGLEIFTGTGTVDVEGISTSTGSSYGFAFIDTGFTNHTAGPLTVASAATASPAIKLTGLTSGSAQGLRLFGYDAANIIQIVSSSTTGGGIELSGRAASSVDMYLLRAQVLSRNGAITVSGGVNQLNLDWNGGVGVNRFGSLPTSAYVTTSSADITLISDNWDFDSNGHQFNTSGDVSVLPYTGRSFGSGGATFGFTTNNIGNLTIGKAPTGSDRFQPVMLTGTHSVSGEIRVYGGNLDINGSSTFLKASTVSLVATDNLRVYDDITTTGGDIWLQSRATDAAEGGIYTNVATFDSNGGDIFMSGGSNPLTDFAIGTFERTDYIGVNLNATTNIFSRGGDIVIRGSQGADVDPDLGGGVYVNPGNVINSGTGDISIVGRLANQNNTATHGAVLSGNSGTSTPVQITATTGDIFISGDGSLNLRSNRYGVLAYPSSITTTDGNVTISGWGQRSDVAFAGNASNIRSTNGSVEILGTGVGTSELSAIVQAKDTIVLQDDSPNLISNTTFTGSARVTIQSSSSAFTTVPTLTNGTYHTGLSGLTLGRESETGTWTLNKVFTINGPITVYGGTINAQQDMVVTSTSADITLKSTGNITTATNVDLRTRGGDIILWSDSDNSGAGAIAVGSANTICTGWDAVAATCSLSQGGDVVLGGGAADSNDATRPGGLAQGSGTSAPNSVGVSLGACVTNATGVSNTIVTRGGDLSIRGVGSTGSLASGTLASGVVTCAGNDVNVGVGKILIESEYRASNSSYKHGVWFAPWLSTPANTSVTFRSENPDDDAVKIIGRGGEQDFVSFGLTILNLQGGGAILEVGSLHPAAPYLNFDSRGSLEVRPASQSFTVPLAVTANFGISTSAKALVLGSASNTESVSIQAAKSIAGDVTVLAGGLEATGNVIVTGAGSKIRAVVDTIVLTSNLQATNSGVIEILPRTVGRNITLGAEQAGTLSIENAEAGRLIGTYVRIGSQTSGDITLAGNTNFTKATNVKLVTPGSVSRTNNAILTAANLAIDAGGGVSLPGANSVSGSVAISASSFAQYSSAVSYSPATVDGVLPLFGIGVAVSQTNSPAVQNRNAFLAVTFNPPPQFVVTDTYSNTLDSNNRLAASYTVSATVAQGTGTVTGLTSSFSNNVYSFNNLRVDTNPGTYSFTITVDDGANGFSTNSVDYKVMAGEPGQLSVVATDTVAPAGKLGFSISVTVEDSSGNPITAGENKNITVSASVSGQTSRILSGGTARADDSGVANFDNLIVSGYNNQPISLSFFVTYEQLSDGQTVTVSSTVTTISLTPGDPYQLLISGTSQVAANRSTLSNISIAVFDEYVNQLENFSGTIQVALESGAQATLSGTTVSSISSFLAETTFNNLSLQGQAGNYNLVFSLVEADVITISHSVLLTAGEPQRLELVSASSGARSGLAFDNQPAFFLVDVDGNLVNTDASISATATGVNLSGTTTIELSGGIGAFSDLVLTGGAGDYSLDYQLIAPAQYVGISTSETITLTAGNPAKLKVSQQPQSVVAGVAQAVSVSVQVLDAQDNLTTVTSNTTINLVLQNYGAGAAVVETTSPVVLSAGQSTYTYSNLVLTKAGQTMRLVFTASGLVDATSDFFSIAAAAPDNLQWVTNVSDATNDVAMNPAPTVRVFDEFGNAVVTQSAQTSISVSVIVGGANVLDLSGGTAQTDGSSSLVSLNNLVLRAKVGSYQIRITAENPGQPIDGFTLDSEMFNLGFGAATSLTTSPSALSVVNRATLTDITVSVLDSAGNLVADNTQAITPTVSGIALSGSALNAVGGQATFSSLVLTGLVGNYDLGFTATSVLGATTSVSVTHAAAYAISLSAPAAVKNAMTASEIVAKILDQDGNLVTTGSQSTQTVELTVSAAVLSGDIAVSASAGIATFSNVAITGSVSNKVITATIAAPTEITESQTVTLGFGDPYSLDLTQAADGFANREVFVTAPEVTVRDVSGNVVQATGMDIRVTVATASISGSITASAASGVAQFASDLVVRGLAGSHTLVFTAEGVSSSDVVVASQTFTLNHGAASQLVVTESPAGILSGIDFETQPSLELRDPEGNRVSTSAQATGQVIVSYSGNDWTNTRQGVDLSGTTTITLTGGQGQFTNLRLSGKAGNYTIKYTYQTDTSISVSEAVSVEPGTETKLAILQQPQNIVAGEAFAQDVAVEILDPYDNRVQRLTQSATVRAKLIEADDSTLITYSDAVGATQGVVSFSGLTFVSQGDRKIVFEKDPGSSTPALTSVTSTQFTITHAAASTLSWIVEPQVTVMNDAVIAGVGAASPSFRAFDEFGNVIDTGVVKLSVVSVGGNTPLSISGNSVDGVSGTVTIPQLKLRALVGDYDLEFRAFTDTNASTFATLSHQIEVLHGVPTQLTTSAHATAARAGIDLTPQPQLRILDSAGNLVSNSSLVVYAAADGATLVGANQLAATNGVSSFTGLSLTGSASSAVTLSYEISYQSSSISTSIVIPLLAGDAATASLSWTVTDVQTRVAPQNTPLVELFDVFGNKVLSDSTSTATAKLFKNGSLVTESATTYVASSGEIRFNTLALKATPGSNYFYQFEVAGLTPVSSSQFVMLPGPVAKVHIHQQPATIVNGITTTMTGETFEQVAIVHLLDQDDNIVTTVNSGDVTTALSTGSGGSLISASASISNGVATFTHLKLIGVVETPEQTAEDYKLTFSYGGFDSVESGVLRVKHNLASSLSLEVAAANGRSGIAFTQQAVVKLRDRYNNWVSTGQSVTITGELVGASAPAATLGSISVPTVNGVSTLSVTITGPVENSYTIRYLADNNQGVPISYVEQSGITITHGTHDKVRIIRNVASLDQNNDLTMIGEAFHIQPIIEVLDSANNRVLDYNGLIVASISSTVRGDRDYLTGYTVSAVAGVATFSDLAMVGQVFTDYQITFNRENRSGGSAVSTSFQLTHGLAEYLTIETQPQGGNKTGSALSVSPVIAVRDFDGNIATTLNGPSVSAAILTGGGTVDTTGSNTEKALVENGIAAFSNLTVVALPGQDQTLGFTLDGALNSASAAVTSTQSATFSLIVADAYKLSVFTEPCTAADCSAGPTAELLGIQPVVEIQDRFGNRVPGFTGEVTATLQGTVGSLRDDDGQISSRSVTVVNGLATFTDLRIEGVPGNNYRLQFAATGLVSTTSQDVQVMHTTPSQVVFTQQPVGGITGELLAGQPVLEVRDRFGNKAVTDNSTQVTVSVLSGPLRVNGQAAEISGSLTVTAVNGTVTFSELELIGKTNENYVLRFAAAGYFVDSQPVVVSPAGANVLEWIVEPIAQRTGEAMGTQPVLRMLDFDGNLASSTAATVTVTVSSGGGYIEAGTTSAAVDGVITFSGLTLVAAPNAPQTLTFTATTAGGAFSINTTAPLRVEHTDASQMVIDSTYAALSEQGRVLGTQPVIKLYDRFGNPAVNDNSTVVTATIGSGAGGAVSGSATATAVAGVVTFAGLAVTGSPGVVYTLDFSAGGYGVAGTSNLQLFKTAELEVSYSNIVYSSSPTTTPAIAFTDSTEHSISFTVSTPQFCTIDQNTGEVTIVSAGTCVISATVLAGPFYKFISKDVNLVIQKAEQSTVVFSNSAEVVFGQLLTLVAKGGESTEEIEISARGCTLLGDKLSTIGNATEGGASTCRVFAFRPGDQNYEDSNVARLDVIVKRAAQAPISIGNPRNVTVGNVELFILGGSGAGTVSYEVQLGTNTAQCSIANGVLSASKNGSCEVVASKAQDINFNVATSPAAVFTFTKQLQSVTITSAPPPMPLPGTSYLVNATASGATTISFAVTKGQEIQATQLVSASTAVCQLSQSVSGQVTFLRSGECEITATAASSDRFASATAKISILVGQLNQFITFNPLPDLTYGAPAFRLTAVASSGLPVSYTVSAGVSVCSISNGMVTINAAGTCEIRASQAGNGSYAPAPNVIRSFQVNPGQASSPALVSAAVGNQWFTVGFTAPSYNGGSEIFAYRLEVRDQNGNLYVSTSTNTQSPLSITAAGIPNDTPYTAKVAAITSAGIGQFSNTTVSLTPSDAAMSVTQLTAETSVSGLELSWVTPEALEGNFLRYEVYAWVTGTEEPLTPTTTITNSASDQVTIATSSISNEISISPASYVAPRLQIVQPLYRPNAGIYQFGVARTAPVGFFTLASIAQPATESAAVGYTMRVVTITDTYSSSQVINTANGVKVGLSAPSAPTQFNIDSSDPSKLTITWAAPNSDGGFPLIDYQVTSNGDVICANIQTRICEVAPLDASTTYNIEVKARNALGHGDAAAGSHTTPNPPVIDNQSLNEQLQISLGQIPKLNSFVPRIVRPGQVVNVTGEKLDTLYSLSLGGQALEYLVYGPTSMAFKVPVGTQPGSYNIIHTSPFGQVTVMDAIFVAGDPVDESLTPVVPEEVKPVSPEDVKPGVPGGLNGSSAGSGSESGDSGDATSEQGDSEANSEPEPNHSTEPGVLEPSETNVPSEPTPRPESSEPSENPGNEPGSESEIALPVPAFDEESPVSIWFLAALLLIAAGVGVWPAFRKKSARESS